MKRPNFFIVGAPKCGTTSLAAWLGAHPQVFMTAIKEPHYFNSDHAQYVVIKTLTEYERHFKDAKKHHLAVGEASVWYLYSEVAIPNIIEYAPDAKFIVCLRNPVEMVYSLYRQKLYSCDEHIQNFYDAWNLRAERWERRAVTRWCREPRQLAYDRACMLGEQVERLYRIAGKARVLPILLDDLSRDPRAEYLKALSFLGVSDDGRKHFPVLNTAKSFHSTTLQRLIRMGAIARRRMGLTSFGIGRLNRRESTGELLPLWVRRELANYFAKDIAKLGSLLGRDLSYWTRF